MSLEKLQLAANTFSLPKIFERGELDVKDFWRDLKGEHARERLGGQFLRGSRPRLKEFDC